ncbi:MAG TPA: hypothetical protein VG326_17695 [Tepidisphaeraceae bacterium]|jgi:multisubunit Na+/H+ antiporter MnhE subunit|nr:hypothetical protein [Tepidisphaeraceae bacterium]
MWRGKTPLIVAVTVLVHWILWLAYTNNVGFREMIAGAVAAVISAVGAAVFAEQGNICFRFRRRDLIQAVYLPWYALTGTWEVLQSLAKQLFTQAGAPSLIAAVAFDVGDDDPICAGRRALAVSYTTITPNFVVLGIVYDQRLLLYHQILPGEVLTMTRHLGARP